MKKQIFWMRTFPFIIIGFMFAGWGNVGHKIINANTVNSFPQAFQQFSFWKDELSAHASDADYRKSADPNEGPKHYIDFEEYNDFVTKGTVIQDYDSAKTKYGVTAITNAGSLPWTIIQYYDSLIEVFKQKDWQHAVLLSADLGHYIGDGNMPLHLSANYNGRPSSPKSNGIHSRYESTMIGKYTADLVIRQKEAVYLSNVQDFIFSMTYQNHLYVDSVYAADSIAYLTANSTSSSLYYSTLWSLTKDYTGVLFSQAAEVIASVMYTAWVNAGSPPIAPTFVDGLKIAGKDFSLEQNYPNPFNPSTVINYHLGENAKVTLKIFDIAGKEISTIVDDEQEKGNHQYEIQMNDNKWTSGVYFYQLKAGAFVQTKKMIYLR